MRRLRDCCCHGKITSGCFHFQFVDFFSSPKYCRSCVNLTSLRDQDITPNLSPHKYSLQPFTYSLITNVVNPLPTPFQRGRPFTHSLTLPSPVLTMMSMQYASCISKSQLLCSRLSSEAGSEHNRFESSISDIIIQTSLDLSTIKSLRTLEPSKK